jgi:hypothetical protein
MNSMPGEVVQRPAIAFEDLPLAPHPLFQHSQSPATNGGEDVAQAIIVANLGVLVVGAKTWCMVLPLSDHETQTQNQIRLGRVISDANYASP